MQHWWQRIARVGVGCTVLAMLATCRGEPAPYSADDFVRVPKIDAHVHYNTTSTVPMQQAVADNMTLLTINVDYAAFPKLPLQVGIAHSMQQRYPGAIFYAASFSTKNIDKPTWAAQTIQQLQLAKQNGAVAVKLWKNVGMQARNSNGDLVQMDDTALDPVIDYVQQAGLPLISHQGEPRSCWHPVGEMISKTDRKYYTRHPEYHMFLQPNMPSYEALMAARDRFMARHTNLKFVGAHLASLEGDVDAVAAFLDAHPKTMVDLSARMVALQYQSVKNYEKVRRFFIRYANRIIYGSDLILSQRIHPQALRKAMHKVWRKDWMYLATGDSQHVPDIGQDVQGLALPRDVVDAIYYTNAARMYGLRPRD